MLTRIPLDRIDHNPYQTRKVQTSVTDLKASIRHFAGSRPETSGLIHVPVGRVVLARKVLDCAEYGGVLACLGDEPNARVQIAAGHRRYQAFTQLAQSNEAYRTFPVDVGVLNDQEMADIAWQENADREDISPIEEAEAIRRAMDKFGWTQAEVGRRWDLTQGAISNKLRLLKLPQNVRTFILHKWIAERHGRALLPLMQLRADEGTMVDLLTHGSRRDARGPDDFRSVAELEVAIKVHVEEKTLKIEWDLDWMPEGDRPGVETTVTCQDCESLIKFRRQKRCRRAGCFRSREKAHQAQVIGPQKARELHAQYNGWVREEMTRSYQRCEACGGRIGEVEDGPWYTARWRYVCPGCWRQAGLPEPEPPQAEEIAAVPIARSGEATEASITAARPVMRPVEPTEPAEPPEPPPPPATLVTARILPGEELVERRVMVAIAEEGQPPAAFRTGGYVELADLVVEVCEKHFGNGRGDISREISANGVDFQDT